MYTRCTHCDTVFRVTPQQLQVSSGKVRCGRCHEVFDAFSSLSAQLPAAAQAEVPTPPPIERFEMPPPPSWEVGLEEPEPPSAREATPVAQPPAPDVAPGLESLRPPPSPALPVPERPVPPARPALPEEDEVLTLPDELFTQGASSAHWSWSAGSALLVLLALAQLAWVFATPLAHRLPGARPALDAFCAATGCSVDLPRLPDQLFIEASDLQLLDAARPDEVLLTVTIRNRASVAQAYPLLELTLTGAANQVASRKVFPPQEYLDRGVDRGRGIGANQEVSIRLYLSTGTLRAAGYRLYLFFA